MNKCVLWVICCIITGISSAQTARYSVVINEFIADPTPMIGLPNSEFIELKNTSNKAIQLEKWRIENSSSSAMINISFILEPDSLVILCSKTQVASFNMSGKIIGLTSFPTLTNESGMIILKDAAGKTIHAVSYDQSWYQSLIKSEGGWSLEMIDPKKACDDKNWQASIHDSGGTPGRENSVFNAQRSLRKIQATQCISTQPNLLLLQLNQGGDSLSLSNTDKYTLVDTDIKILSAKPIPPLFKTVELQLNNPIQEKKIYQLNIKEVAHCNELGFDDVAIKTGLLGAVKKNDLIINEILFDPETGGSDFIELYNRSYSVINSKEIYLGARNTSGSIYKVVQTTKENFNVFPGDHIVFTPDTGDLKIRWKPEESLLIELDNMPSMPDDKGNIMILDKQGEVIDEVNYTQDMHFPLLRNVAGVSLERINPTVPSSQTDNWHSASSTNNYATPTRRNSQYHTETDLDKNINIFPELISPNNDGIDDILKIEYAFPNNGSLLSIYVYDYNGRLITTIANNQLCGTKGTITWNGLDKQQRKPSTGLYIVYVESFNLNGRRSRTKKAVAVY